MLGRMGAILRFGQNTVKTPGRTHDNDCVTKGLKVSLKPFQRLGVAHVPEGAKPRQGCRSRAAPWSPSAEGEIPFASFRREHFCARRRVSERNRRRRLLARRGFAYFLFAIEKES